MKGSSRVVTLANEKSRKFMQLTPRKQREFVITDVGEFSESVIEAVGKPVLKGSMDDYYGSWMHDASFRHDGTPDKLWVTRKNDTSNIFEYRSKEYFKNDTGHPMKLPYPFQVGGLHGKDADRIGRHNWNVLFNSLSRQRAMLQ